MTARTGAVLPSLSMGATRSCPCHNASHEWRCPHQRDQVAAVDVKRGDLGIDHKMSRAHLYRLVNECTGSLHHEMSSNSDYQCRESKEETLQSTYLT